MLPVLINTMSARCSGHWFITRVITGYPHQRKFDEKNVKMQNLGTIKGKLFRISRFSDHLTKMLHEKWQKLSNMIELLNRRKTCMYRFKQMLQQHYHTICARADSTKLCTDIKSGQISYIYNSHQIYQASKSSQRSCF